jgi:hypothetical protein
MILVFAFISGVLGRMGGAQGYHTLWRDWGCSAVVVAACWHYLGFHPWVYLAVFLLHWGAFSTYWQKLFKGVDNMWFSGLMVGVALSPILFIDSKLIVLVLARSTSLVLVWGCLNKYLPPKVILWRRDVVEEFSRYFVSL